MAVFQWSGSIQFGAFVAIPVKVKAAVAIDMPSLSMLHDTCNGPAGYVQQWVCKAEVGEDGLPLKIARTATVKGWNGHPVDTEYLAALKAEKSAVVELNRLVPASQIDPRYYERSYDVTPQAGGEKAYVLLLRLLERSGRVAVGTAVLQDRETIVTVRPRDGILALEVMYWPEDLTRSGRDEAAREAIKDVNVSDAELAIGTKLVEMLSADFEPGQYVDLYRERLLAYFATVESGEAAPPKPKALEASTGLDLMAALQASIDGAVEAQKVSAKAKAKKGKAA